MKAIKPLALLVIIVACGVWLLMYQKSKPKPGKPVEHLAPVICTECGKSFVAMYSEGPIKCKFCGKKAAWEAWKCTTCGKLLPNKAPAGQFGGLNLVCPDDQSRAFVRPDLKDLDDPTLPPEAENP